MGIYFPTIKSLQNRKKAKPIDIAKHIPSSYKKIQKDLAKIGIKATTKEIENAVEEMKVPHPLILSQTAA